MSAAIFFVIFILLSSLVMMNLVLAWARKSRDTNSTGLAVKRDLVVMTLWARPAILCCARDTTTSCHRDFTRIHICTYILGKTKRQLSGSQKRIRTHWVCVF